MARKRKQQGHAVDNWYLRLVYADPEFDNDTSRLSSDEIIKKYLITKEELEFYTSGMYQRGYRIDRRESIAIYTDEDKKEITLKIGHDTTQQDFINAWPLVKKLKWSLYGKEDVRQREPESPEIVYVFQKWKYKKLNYGEIFAKYQDGSLMEEPYNRTAFDTPKELSDYCNKFLTQTNSNKTKLKPE